MKNTYENNSSMAARQSMKESAADSQQFASAECAAIKADNNQPEYVVIAETDSLNRTYGRVMLSSHKWEDEETLFSGTKKECEEFRMKFNEDHMRPVDYIQDIKTAFQSPEEAMEALRVLRNHLNMRGDYNIVTPHTGNFNMEGLRNLTLSVTEKFKPEYEGDEGAEYSNFFSIGVEGSHWDTKDKTIIRGIQAATYLLLKKVEGKAVAQYTRTTFKNECVWDIEEWYEVVAKYTNPDSLSKVEHGEYSDCVTAVGIIRLDYMHILDMLDILRKANFNMDVVIE